MSDNTVVNDRENTVVINGTSSETVVYINEATVLKDTVSGYILQANTSGNVLVEVMPTANTIITGLVGPAGRSEESMVYTKLVDFVTDTEMYRGEAIPGALKAQGVWRIRKITIAVDGDITEVWADGVDTFDKVWDDRATYVYGV